MLPYVGLSLLAAFAFAFSSISQKLASKHGIVNHWVFLVYYYLTYVPFLLMIPVLFPVSFPSGNWLLIFLYALAFFVGNIFFTTAIYKVDVSTFAPFFQLQSAFIAILAFAFLGERFSSINYLLIAIMILGSILVSMDEKMSIKNYFSLATFLIILQQICHALSNLAAGTALKTLNSFTFMFWGDLISMFFVLALIPIIGFKNFKIPFAKIKPLFASGLFSTIGALSLFSAFAYNVTLSSALSLLTSPIVLIVSVLASWKLPDLLEKHTLRVYGIRAIGVLLILAAAIKLALVS
ncbi:DMT family transporter [Candidatus Beckwithbacteria bacterium]|nr:DMT family transporter [Candidatus Beckwithbacteria bacterium]